MQLVLDEGQKLTSAHGKNATKNVSDIYKAKAKNVMPLAGETDVSAPISHHWLSKYCCVRRVGFSSKHSNALK